MQIIYSPDYPRRVDRRAERGNYVPEDEPGFKVNASTLGEALLVYQQSASAKLSPYDGSIEGLDLGDPPRYFYYESSTHQRPIPVDIHVFKSSGVELCPKQNLDFALEVGDIISIGELVC